MKSVIATSLLVAAAAATNHEAGQQTVHVVQVGGPNAEIIFAPQNTVAKVGDIVQFQFWPKNHSVVQSTFDKPCVPIGESMPEKLDGFFSGFMPAALAPAGQRLVYSVEVKSEDPMWFYCSQGQHCQGGMVGAINAKTEGERTIEAHVGLAAAAPENRSPQGHVAPGAGGAPLYPIGTGAPTYYPTATGAPVPTDVPAPGPDAPGAPGEDEGLDQATGAASTLTAGLTGLVGLVAAFMAL